MIKGNQKGFTLVELLLATAVFSIALIAITAAVIQLFKAYQSGISIRKTQNTSRVISEELSRQARASVAIAGTNDSLCFFFPANKLQADGEDTNDATRYYATGEKLYKVEKKVTFPAGAPSCDPALFNAGTTTQVSDDEITVLKFDGAASSAKMMELDMRLGTATTVASEIDTTDPDNPICIPGYEYCSMTTIKKSIMARGEQK